MTLEQTSDQRPDLPPEPFWAPDTYGLQAKDHIEPPPTPEMIAEVEAELGYRLPASYIALMESQNGGWPINTCFPTTQPTSWAEDHIAITSIFGIGRSKTYSLCGELGSRSAIEDWGYPPLGVYFADCPSAGHDMVALDYRECGPDGEPSVVHVDQEDDYRVTPLAPDFQTFIAQLVPEVTFAEDPEDIRARALEHVQNAPFSPELQALLVVYPDPALPARLRALAAAIVAKKGFFALHADGHSEVFYGLQFLLYTHSHSIASSVEYLNEVYPPLIALAGSSSFGTGGYAPDFVEDWFEAAAVQGRIIPTPDGWRLTPQAAQAVLDALAQFPAQRAGG